MTPRPSTLSAADRALLLDFERLHARWCAASEAAAAAACAMSSAPEAGTSRDLLRLLELHAEAQRCCLEALQLLRDRPL